MSEQRNSQWLASATPSQISQAFDAGELRELLGSPSPAQEAEASRVATAKDRMYAAAFGMTPPQMRAVIKDSSELVARKAAMPDDVRTLLDQVQAATPEAVAAAEASGALKPLQQLLSAD